MESNGTITLVARRQDERAAQFINTVRKMKERKLVNGNFSLRFLNEGETPRMDEVLVFSSEQPVGGVLVAFDFVITNPRCARVKSATEKLLAIETTHPSRKEKRPNHEAFQSLLRAVSQANEKNSEYWFWHEPKSSAVGWSSPTD